MKLAEKIIALVEARVMVVVRPTKQNIAVLTKRGVYSDDSRYFFQMFDDVLSGKEYSFEASEHKYMVMELDELGIKY